MIFKSVNQIHSKADKAFFEELIGVYCKIVREVCNIHSLEYKPCPTEVTEAITSELVSMGIIDDKEQAREYIQRLEENKNKTGMKQYVSGYARAYRGIVECDEDEFNQGILFMLKNHAARMKKNGREFEGLFAYDSVALAMIAKDRGIEIRGVIINNIRDNCSKGLLTSITRVIEEYSNVNILGLIPHLGTKIVPEELITGVLNGIDIESVFKVKIEKLDFE